MAIRSTQRARELKADAAEHYTRLAEEFGHARRGYRSVDNGGPGGREILWQPLSLFIMALMALIMVCGLQAKRLGMFDFILGSGSAQAPTGSKRWMMNGRAHRVADDRTAAARDPDGDDDNGGDPGDDVAN